MKMERRKVGAVLFLLSVLTMLLIGSFWGNQFWAESNTNEDETANKTDEGPQEIYLVSPSLSSTFLDDEAGICIYTDVSQSLDLSVAKDAYKTGRFPCLTFQRVMTFIALSIRTAGLLSTILRENQ